MKLTTRMKLTILLFNCYQSIKSPMYVIPYKYGRIFCGKQYVWKNTFWSWVLNMYYRIDVFAGRMLDWGLFGGRNDK